MTPLPLTSVLGVLNILVLTWQQKPKPMCHLRDSLRVGGVEGGGMPSPSLIRVTSRIPLYLPTSWHTRKSSTGMRKSMVKFTPVWGLTPIFPGMSKLSPVQQR